ncbi:Metal-dependent hydrolase, beta-lactamase superfamily II [Deinococcus reticulitermitis]|uniref:Metal-dependent hydrolase, beta-lactamase superfamily II n=1 Tax=Deinococcus reticulitermitis TaxID=856736 RepID=A0A1H6SN03_9DEIO|nr:excalibur calcium-binding domain-containing protein [Deinococcus reticulitermitis]SEI66147.1 Metal-dependent hydrolase, beta-lactamase superfamily II [Deinococcus reticulitermitis]
MRRLLSLAALTLGMAAAQAAPSGVLTIRFLDVGQGDSILITAPTGQTMLVDGGRSESRMRELIRQYEVKRLDAVVASHWDSDHITGLVPAVALLKPKLFANNGVAATTQVAAKLVNVVQQAGTQGLLVRGKDQVINLGAVKVTLLAPPPGVRADEQNVNSVGLLVQFGTFRALMTGDSETEETNGWLRKYAPAQLGPVDVYKSIHHGAANGDNARWLAAIRPRNVIISVGPNNYGHPTQTALSLYQKAGARVWRTDLQGTITVSVKPDGSYTVGTEKGKQTLQGRPVGNPATAPQPAPARPVPTPPPAPANVTYRSCAEARAAGAAPLRAGQPGYSRNLDRDGDGVACEK